MARNSSRGATVDTPHHMIDGPLRNSISKADRDVGGNDTERRISTVLADVLGVGAVSPGQHFFDDLGADSMVMARFCARLRKLDGVPAVSMKDVYRHPTVAGLAAALAPQAPAVPDAAPRAEAVLSGVLAGVIGAESVPRDAHFFDDLGADSMVMARFLARLRKMDGAPPVSMKDVYRNPTIAALAGAVAAPAPAAEAAPLLAPPVERAVVPVRARSGMYVLCGVLQFAIFLAYTCGVAVVAAATYRWIGASVGLWDFYLRAVLAGGGAFLAMCLLPILVKWTLVGRWKPREIRLWSLDYVRFWIVKTMVRANPLVLVASGSPLVVLYLRALGAKIGKNVAFMPIGLPVCTDLLTIGEGTLVRKGAILTGYRARAGKIEVGPVSIGANALVSDATVLDIDTVMGDGSQLAHASSLQAGQRVPAGESWHGSPAERSEVDYRTVEPLRPRTWRKITFSATQLLKTLLIYVPLGVGFGDVLVAKVPQLSAMLPAHPLDLTAGAFYVDALVVSAVLFFGATLVGLVFVCTVPRLLSVFVRPDRVYPLYGFRYGVHRTIGRLTNLKFYTHLFGDSSYIVGYLAALGYDLLPTKQTGSNFGTGVKHETPYRATVGSGTMVADDLNLLNTDYSHTSFRVSRTTIGAENFLGNRIFVPPRSRTGDNCLLATKVMVPIDGPVRHDVGLLGSPAFEIPRTVERDGTFDHLETGEEFRRRLSAKNRYNLRTLGLVLMVRWVHVFGILLMAMFMADFFQRFGALAIAGQIIVTLIFTLVYFTFVERAIARFRPLRSQFCSIYDPYFWWHERFWKLAIPGIDKSLVGTPMKNVLSRALGVRIGRRVFDDGCAMPERPLVTIGSDSTLNASTVIQAHSQEDGAFKSEHCVIGDGVTLGVGAFVHYGVTVGHGAVLSTDSFLMKGSEVPELSAWGGNPAHEISSTPVPARRRTIHSVSAERGTL